VDSDRQASSRRLIDQSKLLRKRARRRIDESETLIGRAHHNWHQIAAGRVCVVCMTALPPTEYDDDVPCEPRQAG
jgi:hypothetical protein